MTVEKFPIKSTKVSKGTKQYSKETQDKLDNFHKNIGKAMADTLNSNVKKRK
jgi:hypothetical protein